MLDDARIDKLTMAKGRRQDLVSHLFSEGEEVLALACRAAFRQRRFIDVEGNVATIQPQAACATRRGFRCSTLAAILMEKSRARQRHAQS